MTVDIGTELLAQNRRRVANNRNPLACEFRNDCVKAYIAMPHVIDRNMVKSVEPLRSIEKAINR